MTPWEPGPYGDPDRARSYDLIAGLGNLALGGDRRLDARALDALDLAPGLSVLDVGAGTGRLVPTLAAAVGPGGEIFAVDRSPGMLDEAALRGRLSAPGVQSLVARGGALPLADASVDRALLAWVLHELAPDERRSVWSELRRVVRPGGCVVVLDHGQPLGLRAQLAWRLLRRGLVGAFEVDTMSWHLSHPPELELARDGWRLAAHEVIARGLVRVLAAERSDP